MSLGPPRRLFGTLLPKSAISVFLQHLTQLEQQIQLPVNGMLSPVDFEDRQLKLEKAGA